jgi:hypothetical protein
VREEKMRVRDLIEKLIAVETFYGNLRLDADVDVEVKDDEIKVINYERRNQIK